MKLATGALLALVLACSSPPAPVPVEVPPDAGVAAETEAAPDAGPSIDDLRLAAFTKVIQETASIRHECWARGAADDYKLSGKVVLSFVLAGKDGPPKDVSLAEDTTGDEVLTGCLVERYKRHPWPPVFDDGTTVKAPLQFDVPRGQYTVSADHVPEEERDAGKMLIRHVLHPGNTGNPGVSMTMYELYGNQTLGMHRHDTSATVLFVAGGHGTVSDTSRRKPRPIKAGDMLYFPAGKEHAISHVGETLQLVVVHTPAGPEAQYLPGGKTADWHFLSKKELRKRSKSKLKQVATDKLPKLPIAGGKGWVRIAFETSNAGDSQSSGGIIHVDKGVAVPKHTHPGASEVLYIYTGEGTMTVAGREFPVKAPMAVQIPPDVEHSFVATADVEALQYYTPSGAEQRFKPKK